MRGEGEGKGKGKEKRGGHAYITIDIIGISSRHPIVGVHVVIITSSCTGTVLLGEGLSLEEAADEVGLLANNRQPHRLAHFLEFQDLVG